MKKFLLLASLALPAAYAETTVFVNVNVVPMSDESVVANQTVIVVDKRIESIGHVDEVPVPEGSVLVDGTNRYLMPGLAEMHAHIPPASANSLERVLALFALNGVTTVRGMLGHPSHIELTKAIESGEVFGPQLYTSGPSLNGNSVSGAADARQQVRDQKAGGYGFLKLHPGLSLAEFDAIAETARQVGIPFAGHVSVAVGVRHALASGMASIEHLDGYFVASLSEGAEQSGGYGGFFDVLLAAYVDPDKIAALAAETASTDTWNAPTQVLFENVVSAESAEDLGGRPEMRYMPMFVVNGWISSKRQFHADDYDPDVAARSIELRRRLIKALHDNGAKLLLASDAPQIFNVPGFSIHRELQSLVDAGLTPFEALQTGTTNAALFLDGNFGRVEPGYRADLVLLDDNPLEDIANTRRVHGIVLNGTWVSSPEREQRLESFRRSDQ
ncbi:MAG: amidohydrolase family protein [Woeseiaceae bacterium]|nr:amidohydrolase family protein [Woeseiaceae bacterium]